MLDLVVVVVTWNTRELTLQTLRSLYADLDTAGLRVVVYVVDNASSDDTAAAITEQFPQARLFALADNLGFGGGNNYALRQMGFGAENPADDLPRAVYLLNSDTITQPGATRTLFDALMADSSVGWVGARLTYADGAFQDGAFMFPGLKQIWAEFFPTPGRFILGQFNGRYARALYDGDQSFPVDFTLGATVMLRREVIQQTGMFDESYFMYCEEIDWAWRVRKAGWTIQCVPAAHVVHLGGQSTGQVRPQSQVNLWTSRLLLFRRYFARWKFWLARKMIAVGMSRKIRQAWRDESLSPEQRDELVAAYEQIRQMASRYDP